MAEGGWCYEARRTARTDRRVENSPHSSWCIRSKIVRGRTCLVNVARIDVNVCSVSIDGIDSMTDLG